MVQGRRAPHTPSQGARVAGDVLAGLALEVLHAKQEALQYANAVKRVRLKKTKIHVCLSWLMMKSSCAASLTTQLQMCPTRPLIFLPSTCATGVPNILSYQP
jgi:hypothetical protein